MIISHKHQFIFFAVPKTATHAVRFALRPLLGDSDEEQVGLYVKKSLSYPDFQQIGHGHISAMQAKAVLPEEIWNNYFKFAFVRNPFDRFVSFAFYMNRRNRSFTKNTNKKMKMIMADTSHLNKILFRPQVEIICDAEDRIMPDFIGQFENFQGDFEKICSKLNIPTPQLPHFNATQHKPFTDYYDEELHTLVANFYQKDINLFDYKLKQNLTD